MDDKERKRLFEDWYALRDACLDYHNNKKRGGGGAGGARVCVCGSGCGGSKACSMLGIIRDIIRYHTDKESDWEKDFFETMKGIV